MRNLILLGGGGHCESVIAVIEMLSEFKIQGILDPIYSKNNAQFILGYPILGNDNKIEELKSKKLEFVITVGQIKSPSIRKKLFEKVKLVKGKLPIIISSTAYVSKHTKVGEGTVVMNFSLSSASALDF